LEREIGLHFLLLAGFFGRNLYDHFKVPLGLVSDNWGGTIDEAWSSPQALAKCKRSPVNYYLKDETVWSTGYTGPDPNTPSVLWNAMIVPVLPMTILGATWYQGESNAGNPDSYACSFPAMIADWRLKWGGNTPKDFGFYYVQLAPWINNGNDAEALTRMAQLFANKLPKVGFATAIDLGDPTSPFGSIHPRDKQDVGLRLSLSARAISFQEKIPYKGPLATSFTVINGTTPVAHVSFDPVSVGSGLVAHAMGCPPDVPAVQCAGYELGTAKGWIPAKGDIVGEIVVVSGAVGKEPITGVRYGYANYPLATLRNKDGLPGIPIQWSFIRYFFLKRNGTGT